MHIRNLAVEDYFDLPNALADGPSVEASVSLDVVWNGPVTRQVNVSDGENGFTGSFFENQVTVTWRGTNELGFGFFGDPGDFSTSVPGRTWSEIGHERNGIFFPPAPAPGPTPQYPPQESPASPPVQPVLKEALASWQAAAASIAPFAVQKQVKTDSNPYGAQLAPAAALSTYRAFGDMTTGDVDVGLGVAYRPSDGHVLVAGAMNSPDSPLTNSSALLGATDGYLTEWTSP